jgi:hypothetical protein
MEQQLVEMEKKPNMLAFKAAAGYAVYFLILIYLFKLLGINTNDPNISTSEKIVSSALSYIPFILAIIYVQYTHRLELGGFISFGRAFSAGFKVAAYTGLFNAVILLIYYKILDTNAFEEVMNTALEAAGDDENQIKGVEMMRSYMVFFIAFSVAVVYTFFGLVVSLIGASVLKKVKPLDEY